MGMPGRFGLTYDRPGATRDDTLPAGWDHLDLDEPIGRGREAFERAVDGLMTWRMQQRAGLTLVSLSAERAAPGVEALLRIGPFRIPCRVVYTVDEPDRRGFAYGTLPGHPECGEEAFTVRIAADGEVRGRIRAFSRPATLLPRLGGPLLPVVQRVAARRYLRALRGFASGSQGG